MVVTRKIMAAYVKRLPDARQLRGKMMHCERLEELEAIFDVYLADLDADARYTARNAGDAVLPSAC